MKRIACLLDLVTTEAFFKPRRDIWCRQRARRYRAPPALILQLLRYIAIHDGRPDNGCFANARLTDSGGIVLGASREDLHHAIDLNAAQLTDCRLLRVQP